MATHNYALRSIPGSVEKVPVSEPVAYLDAEHAGDEHNGQLAIINFTGVDAAQDYELSLKHYIASSTKSHFNDFTTNDLLVLRQGDHHLTVARIIEVTNTANDDFLNDGGAIGKHYITFMPIIVMSEKQCRKDTETHVKVFSHPSQPAPIQHLVHKCTILHFLLSARDLVERTSVFGTPEVMFLYNSWHTENHPHSRCLAFKTMLIVIHMATGGSGSLTVRKMTDPQEREFVSIRMKFSIRM
jgi:hypothetical protein